MKRTKKVVLGLAVMAMLSFAVAGTARADHRSRSRGYCAPPPSHHHHQYYRPYYGGSYYGGGYYVPPRRYYYSPPIHGHYHHYVNPGFSFGYSGRHFSFYLGR